MFFIVVETSPEQWRALEFPAALTAYRGANLGKQFKAWLKKWLAMHQKLGVTKMDLRRGLKMLKLDIKQI